jgi:cation diffusion facilitator CzcD-associated flavoprotein CzcO
MPSFPAQDQFKGSFYHASAHKDASLHPDVAGKKVVVVGTGNSGHDICQNYHENGADVTMLQRGGTYVMTAKKGVPMLHAGLYDESGPPTEDADIYAQSMPVPVAFTFSTLLTKKITAVDQTLLDGLANAGFKLDFGPQGAGVMRKYLTRGGGYYIDVGCSELIAEGKVKVRQSDGIKQFYEHGLVLADGSKLPADVVVLATGYDNMRTSARKVFGDKVADRLYDVWDLDEEGEMNAVSYTSLTNIGSGKGDEC